MFFFCSLPPTVTNTIIVLFVLTFVLQLCLVLFCLLRSWSLDKKVREALKHPELLQELWTGEHWFRCYKHVVWVHSKVYLFLQHWLLVYFLHSSSFLTLPPGRSQTDSLSAVWRCCCFIACSVRSSWRIWTHHNPSVRALHARGPGSELTCFRSLFAFAQRENQVSQHDNWTVWNISL